MATNFKKLYKTNKAAYTKLKVLAVRPKKVYKKKRIPGSGDLFNNPTRTSFLPVSKYAITNYNEQSPTGLSTGPAGTAGGYIYACNGGFDPNISGDGHQPMGFDTAMTFYEHYTVTDAKFSIRFFNKNQSPIAIGAYLSPDPTILTSAIQINENGMIKQKWIANVGGGGVTTINFTVNMNKYFGKNVMNEDDYRGDSVANPLELVYLILFAYSPDLNLGTTAVPFEIDIKFRSKYTEPRKQIVN